MLAAVGMLRQSSGGGSGGGSGGNKRSLGISRISNFHFFPLSTGMGTSMGTTATFGTGGRRAKSSSLSSISSGSDSLDAPAPPAGTTNPDYIMQLVNDVRKFADVLLHFKESFHSKGEFRVQSLDWGNKRVTGMIMSGYNACLDVDVFSGVSWEM